MTEIIEKIHEIIDFANDNHIAPNAKYISSKLQDYGSINVNLEKLRDLLRTDKSIYDLENENYILNHNLDNYKRKYHSEEAVIEALKDDFFLDTINIHVSRSKLFTYDNIKKDYEADDECYQKFISEKMSCGYITEKQVNEAISTYDLDVEDFLYDIEDRGIKILSKDEFEGIERKQDKLQNRKNFKVNVESNEKLAEGNILLTDIRIHETVAIAVVVFLIGQKSREGFEIGINDKQKGDLERFSLIKPSYSSQIELTSLGKELGGSVLRYFEHSNMSMVMDIIENYSSFQEIAKGEEIKRLTKDNNFWDYITPYFVESYKRNKYSKMFFDFLKDANGKGFYNMEELYLYAINEGHSEVLNQVLIGEKATSGLKPINENLDICYICQFNHCNKLKHEMKNTLIGYRSSYTDRIIEKYRGTKEIGEIIKQDLLLIKFMAPFSLVVSSKLLLRKLGIITKSSIHYKNNGSYCQKNDIWEIL